MPEELDPVVERQSEDSPHPVAASVSRLGGRRMWFAIAQAAAVIAVAGLIVQFPDRSSEILTRLAGGLLVARAASSFVTSLRPPLVPINAALSALGAAVGGALMAGPDSWRFSIARTAGGVLVLIGAWLLLGWIRSRTPWRQRAFNGILLLSVGAALIAAPNIIFTMILWLVASLLTLHAMVSTGVQLGITEVNPESEDDEAMRPLLRRWVEAKGKSRQRRDDVHEQVFFEGPAAVARTARYALMMLFASVISAMGVLTDSTAVVIGAMLVAPLITPMMGMGMSLAMGWPNRLARSTFAVLAGIAIAVGTGWFLASALDLGIDLTTNSQITSRSSPTIADLVIAIAAGAAGAYALSRKDVSSSLPGVAIAIALVPPLSVVGVAAQAGDWEQARGTLLLFLTNLVAILIVGGAVFVLTGIAPIQRAADNQHRVRTALSAVTALAVIVVGGLVLNGKEIAVDALANDNARRTVVDWLGDEPTFAIVSIDTNENDVAVVLAGPGDPPVPGDLAAKLASSLNRSVRLDLQWIPRERAVIVSSGS